MQKTISTSDRIYELRKSISLLEWDIHNIQDARLKGMKQSKLEAYKKELSGLLVQLKNEE